MRTLRTAGNFEELTYETRRYGWNILGLSDVWWKNFDETSTLEGHKWYFSGKEENHEQVGISCSKGHREHCHGLPSRLKQSYHHPPECKSIEHHNYTDPYAPITDYDNDAVEDSYDHLQEILYRSPKEDMLVVSGDWNAKVGEDAFNNWKGICGRWNLLTTTLLCWRIHLANIKHLEDGHGTAQMEDTLTGLIISWLGGASWLV